MTTEPVSSKAKEYQHRQLKLGLIEEGGTLLFLLVWVRLGPWLVGQLPDWGRYLQLIVTATVIYVSYQVVLCWLDYLSDYRLEHEYNLSTEALGQWLWRHTKAITLAGLLLGVMVVLLYTALWYLKYWYFWCWLGWVLFSILLAQVFPVLILPLFHPSKRLENEALLERFRRLSEGTGVTVEGVYSLELSNVTKKGNAMLAGLGRTRRVLLGDTLLARLTEDQLEVVYAHELGHHVHRHFFKGLILHSLGSVVFFSLLCLVLNPFAGNGATASVSVARLPMVALGMALFTFLWRPVLFAFTRHFEVQSDQYALSRTAAPEHFVTAFEALADQNLADPDPPGWVVWLYHDHPPIARRIAMAKNTISRTQN